MQLEIRVHLATNMIIVGVKTNFTGCHRWEDVEDEAVQFLANWHRHIFYVNMQVEVTDANREIEFFTLKRELGEYCLRFHNEYFEYSCEQIAEMIAGHFDARQVSVSEDNENYGLFIK